MKVTAWLIFFWVNQLQLLKLEFKNCVDIQVILQAYQHLFSDSNLIRFVGEKKCGLDVGVVMKSGVSWMLFHFPKIVF